MKSQVDPQIRHSSSQTTRDFMFRVGSLLSQVAASEASGTVPARHARVFKNQVLRVIYADGGFNLINAKAAPCGSVRIEKRPVPGMSSGGFITLPPSSFAFCVDASQSSTAK